MTPDIIPTEVPAPYHWQEVPSLGGNRTWQLRMSKDSSDVLHVCTWVFFSMDDGIYVVEHGCWHGKRIGTFYASVDAAIKASLRKYNEDLDKRAAGPVRDLWEYVMGLESRIQALEDRIVSFEVEELQ